MPRPANLPVTANLPESFQETKITTQDIKIFNYNTAKTLKEKKQLLKMIAGANECNELIRKAKQVAKLPDYPELFKPIMTPQGQPLMPTAVIQPFDPKELLATGKMTESQHIISGGVLNFDGDINALQTRGYIASEIRHISNKLLSSSLLE